MWHRDLLLLLYTYSISRLLYVTYSNFITAGSGEKGAAHHKNSAYSSSTTVATMLDDLSPTYRCTYTPRSISIGYSSKPQIYRVYDESENIRIGSIEV